ncbi:hypothetical protein [Embleya hyalina]|uniref:hypothetical protein n=1 Tax=Embleya hyalina TaxID=516124 RepID=UPI000F82AF58|nr:hypothetical protein [Embleya hyalina]
MEDRIVGGDTLLGCEPGPRRYRLDGKYRTFDARLRVPSSGTTPVTVTLTVDGFDGGPLVASATAMPGGPPATLHANMQGVGILSLTVQRSDDPADCSPAELLQPVLTK